MVKETKVIFEKNLLGERDSCLCAECGTALGHCPECEKKFEVGMKIRCVNQGDCHTCRGCKHNEY